MTCANCGSENTPSRIDERYIAGPRLCFDCAATDALKNCPACGGEACEHCLHDFCVCNDCGMRGPISRMNDDGACARAAWNALPRRHDREARHYMPACACESCVGVGARVAELERELEQTKYHEREAKALTGRCAELEKERDRLALEREAFMIQRDTGMEIIHGLQDGSIVAPENETYQRGFEGAAPRRRAEAPAVDKLKNVEEYKRAVSAVEERAKQIRDEFKELPTAIRMMRWPCRGSIMSLQDYVCALWGCEKLVKEWPRARKGIQKHIDRELKRSAPRFVKPARKWYSVRWAWVFWCCWFTAWVAVMACLLAIVAWRESLPWL